MPAKAILEVASLQGIKSIVQGTPKIKRDTKPTGETIAKAASPKPIRKQKTATEDRPYAVQQSEIERFRQLQKTMSAPLDGRQTIIAVIEDGLVDFTHPDLRNADGTTRFLSIWQQDQNNLAAPVKFGYGSEYTAADINRELAGKTHYFKEFGSEAGHPTPIFGLAAGNGNATGTNLGMAPKANLVYVSTATDGVNTIDAVRYVFALADSLKMPCAISFSLGNNLFGYDVEVANGADFLKTAISEMLNEKPGRIITSLAGNNDHIKRHIKGAVSKQDNIQAFAVGVLRYQLPPKLAKKIKLKPNPDHYMSFELKNSELENLQLSSWITSRNKEYFVPGPANDANWLSLSKLSAEPYKTIVLKQGPDTLYSVRLRVTYSTDTTSTLQIKATEHAIGSQYDALGFAFKGTGNFEGWTDFSWSTLGPKTLADLGITSGYIFADNLNSVPNIGDAEGVVAAGNFVNQTEFRTNKGEIHTDTTSGKTGSIYNTSQTGSFRNGTWRPFLLVTAHGVAAALVTDDKKDEVILEGGWHWPVAGTSMGAPLLAGVAALYLQQNPTATYKDFMAALAASCDKDEFTGLVPNSKCGYGKLNLYKLFSH